MYIYHIFFPKCLCTMTIWLKSYKNVICSLTSYSNRLYMPLFNVPILLNLLVNSAVPFVNPLAFCYGGTHVDRTCRFYSFLSDLSTVFFCLPCLTFKGFQSKYKYVVNRHSLDAPNHSKKVFGIFFFSTLMVAERVQRIHSWEEGISFLRDESFYDKSARSSEC